uniref:Galactosylgalactosylxylosylprotein 3-beta-glucuronosyltransferase n=1 Tax=Timema monikensis TaxID=170555 RepID=A0A7R9E171_9NEOP|nr:unnamed protein product [Timema monikensis]
MGQLHKPYLLTALRMFLYSIHDLVRSSHMRTHHHRSWLLVLAVLSILFLFLYQTRLSRPETAARPCVPEAELLIRTTIERLPLKNLLDVERNKLGQLFAQLGDELSTRNNARTPPPPPPVRPIYIITPTYPRPEQVPELIRMSQTLLHVKGVHWLVVEDAEKRTESVTNLLARSGISHDHLLAPMPDKYKANKGAKPRGVSNRNRGLSWLRANATTGVFFFADDDNTYDLRLFEELRSVRVLGMWPVGLVTYTGLSSPVVKGGQLKGFYDGWVGGRQFPVDMAGFGVSVDFLMQRPGAEMPYRPGYEEDGFLKSLKPFDLSEIELKADNCTKILVWHTQTKKNKPARPLNMTKFANSNIGQLNLQITVEDKRP